MDNDFVSRNEFVQYSEKIDAENHRQNRRLEDVEKTAEKITDLTVAINKMAVNMEQMITTQKNIGDRLKEIEDEPKEDRKTAKASVISAICGALAMAFVAAIIAFI